MLWVFIRCPIKSVIMNSQHIHLYEEVEKLQNSAQIFLMLEINTFSTLFVLMRKLGGALLIQ